MEEHEKKKERTKSAMSFDFDRESCECSGTMERIEAATKGNKNVDNVVAASLVWSSLSWSNLE